MILRLIIFLILNFGALAIGGFFTGAGVPSDWYSGLVKAPWTPPGWVFGFAWTSIMICFTIYLAYLWPTVKNKKRLIILFAVQWILNVIWNPIFFLYQNTSLGMIVIGMLTLLVGYILISYRSQSKLRWLLVLPYLIWLLIASSLNGYILIYN